MSNNRSKVIKVMNTAPGIFSRDDNLAKSPAAPFFYLDGNRTGASDDDAENTIIKHIDTKADADLDDITGHRYTGVVGWKKLFTATSPNSERYKITDNDGDKGICLQIRDQHQIGGISCGLYVGGVTGHEEAICHWTHSVIGIQFQWTNRNVTHKNAGGLQLDNLWLCYMDPDYGIIQYAPVCSGKQWQGDVTIIGDDPAAKVWDGASAGTPIHEVDGRSEPSSRAVPQIDTRGAIDNAQEANGRVIAYVKDSHVDKIRKNKMTCVGLFLTTVPGGQGAAYDNVWDIFCVKLLVHKRNESETNSVKMLSEPRSLRDAMIDNNFIIAPKPVA